MSVYTKLNTARLELQSMELSKSGHNKFAGYKYFELGDFLPEIQNIFARLGLCGIVSYTGDLASLTIVDTEDNSQIVITSPMGSAALKGCHEVQNIGAVETYQRRYLWVTAMEIVEHDALDSSEPLTAKSDSALAYYIGNLQAAESPAELRTAYALSYPKFTVGTEDQLKLTAVYEQMKKQLNKETA